MAIMRALTTNKGSVGCLLVYGDRGRDLCFDPAGSQESAPEFGVAYELAIKNAPVTASLKNGRAIGD
jgi:hypothetical protein